MRGVYHANFKIAALNSARTLMYITAPATAVVEIISATVGNESNATNQQGEVKLTRITSFNADTSTTLTPSKTDNGDQASGSTVKANVTANEPTYTANTDLALQGNSSLSGWGYYPGPDERPTIPPGASMGLRMITAPQAMDTDVQIVYREVG